MPRLTKAQEEAQRKLRRLEGRSLPPEELSRQILRALLVAIPADHAMLFGVDPGTLLFNRLLAYQGQGIDLYRNWLQHIYLVDEPGRELTFPGLMRAGLPVVAIRARRERCWGFPAGYFSGFRPGEFERACREIQTPAGGILRAWFTVHGRKIAALELGRMDAGDPIKASESAFVHTMAPLLGQILGAALARAQRRPAAAAECLPTGVLILDHKGHVTLQTPVVERWFEAVQDAPALLAHSGGVPTPVWTAVAALRAGEAGAAGSAALKVPTRLGPLRLEAASLAENGKVALTLATHRPSFPPELPWWWPLTAAERKVLSLVVQGLTNGQIAGTLMVSENTVESHLSHAYKKLKVSSRTAFLARLFAEVY